MNPNVSSEFKNACHDIKELIKTFAPGKAYLLESLMSQTLVVNNRGAEVVGRAYRVTLPQQFLGVHAYNVAAARIQLDAPSERFINILCEELTSGPPGMVIRGTAGGAGPEFTSGNIICQVIPPSTTSQHRGIFAGEEITGLATPKDLSELNFMFVDDQGNVLNSTSTPAIVEWSLAIVFSKK